MSTQVDLRLARSQRQPQVALNNNPKYHKGGYMHLIRDSPDLNWTSK